MNARNRLPYPRFTLAVGVFALALMGGLASAVEPWLSPGVRDSLTPPLSDALSGALILARRAVGKI